MPTICRHGNPKGRAILPVVRTLRQLCDEAHCEARFTDLSVPPPHSYGSVLGGVADALSRHAEETVARLTALTAARPPRGRERKIACDPATMLSRMAARIEIDIYIPHLNLIIEFDERQHFTEERKVSLLAYPAGVRPFPEFDRWVSLCSSTKYDCAPPARDWQRAFRDAIRDIYCHENRLHLRRLCHADFAAEHFRDGRAQQLLSSLLASLSEPP